MYSTDTILAFIKELGIAADSTSIELIPLTNVERFVDYDALSNHALPHCDVQVQ